MKKSYHSSAEPIAEAIATRVRLVCSRAANFACMLACGIGFLPSVDRLSTCRRDPTLRPQRAARTEREDHDARPHKSSDGAGDTAEGKRAERNVDGGQCASDKFGTYRSIHQSCRACAPYRIRSLSRASFFTRRIPCHSKW